MKKLGSSLRTASTVHVWAVIACGLLWTAAAPAAQPDLGPGPPPMSVEMLQIQPVERTPVTGDVVHYLYDFKVGPGEYDRIQVHRMVRETKNHRPIKTTDGLLLVPGAPNSFESIFMTPSVSAVPDWDRSVAVFLAQHDFDVWGITFGWALVPIETTDFGFMEGWGVDRDARDTEIALTLARVVRTRTGQGPGPLHLLGFSYGVNIAAAVAGAESQWPPRLRNVKGLIPLDNAIQLPEGHALQVMACNDLFGYILPSLEGGIFQDDFSFLPLMGEWAIAEPDGVSPIFDWLTNYDATTFLGIVGGFLAGTLDPLATYTEPDLWVDALRITPPYRTMQVIFDVTAPRCGDPNYDPAYDDHLGDIALPVLYIASAGGGEGEIGSYAWYQTASEDITYLMVEGDQGGFAHGDLFLARDAPDWVWQPIVDWLLSH
jgi:hypothetical protein